jgi:hypothetical protein
LQLSGKVTRNTIEEINIHLSADHIRIGGPDDDVPRDNRIEAFMDCQGIAEATGATVFGSNNLLVLSARPFPKGLDVLFERNARANIAILHSPYKAADRSPGRTNRIWSSGDATSGPAGKVSQAAVPASGQPFENDQFAPIEIRIVTPGSVSAWAEQSPDGRWLEFPGPLVAGQSILLNPGERVRFDYTTAPTWRVKAIR